MSNQETCNTDSGIGTAVLLILVGSALLLDKFDLFNLRDLIDLWPLALIGFGAHLLMEEGRKTNPASGEPR